VQVHGRHLGLVGERRLQVLGGALEQVDDLDLAAVLPGIGRRQHFREVRVEHRRLRGLGFGPGARAGRGAPPGKRDHQTGDEGHHAHCGAGDQRAVAAGKLRDLVHQARRPRLNRLVGQEAPQVRRQLGRRAVAASPGVVDEHAADLDRGDPEEVGAALPLGVGALGQSQKRLVDQRSVTRPQDGGTGSLYCDTGAVEVHPDDPLYLIWDDFESRGTSNRHSSLP